MPRHALFVRPAHLIAAPHSLCPAGTSHRRAAISSLQSIRLPAHSLPIHRFDVGPFGRCIPHRAATDLVLFRLASAFPAETPQIWCCSVWPAHSPPSHHRFGVGPFGRRIPRRAATDLVLFRLAGAFPAEPPQIWCCSVWPVHSPPSRHQFGVVSFDGRIPRRAATDLAFFHLAGAFPADLVSSFAGAFAATHRFGVAPFGWRIPSPHHHCPFWPSHPLAAPPLPT